MKLTEHWRCGLFFLFSGEGVRVSLSLSLCVCVCVCVLRALLSDGWMFGMTKCRLWPDGVVRARGKSHALSMVF